MSKNFDIQNDFPNTQRVAILFSGGIESTLLAKLAFEFYGKDNVTLLWSDAIFCKNNTTVKNIIKQNVSSVAGHLKHPANYINIDYQEFLVDPISAQARSYIESAKKFNFSHLLMGITKMVWDVLDLQHINPAEMKEMCFLDKEKYHHVIEQFHLKTDRYKSWVYEMNMHPDICNLLRKDNERFRFPFKNLYKQDVIDLYFEYNFQDIIPFTRSCMKGLDAHCGDCFDCQNRFDAHYISGHPDKTEYISDEVVIRRLKL